MIISKVLQKMWSPAFPIIHKKFKDTLYWTQMNSNIEELLRLFVLIKIDL